MRYMILVKASPESEAGAMPSSDDLVEMGKFNQALDAAGVLRAGEGLHASTEGARVRFAVDERTVIDGPFTETKEIVAGFWILEVASREEALDWARRIPFRDGEVEVRRIFESADFPATDEKAAEVLKWEDDWRAKNETRS